MFELLLLDIVALITPNHEEQENNAELGEEFNVVMGGDPANRVLAKKPSHRQIAENGR